MLGGGLLIDLMKEASKTKDFSQVDEAIHTKVPPYLYNDGQGKMIHCSYLVMLRNKDRPKHKLVKQNKSIVLVDCLVDINVHLKKYE